MADFYTKKAQAITYLKDVMRHNEIIDIKQITLYIEATWGFSENFVRKQLVNYENSGWLISKDVNSWISKIYQAKKDMEKPQIVIKRDDDDEIIKNL